MRVITGSARGRKLAALPGQEVARPTGERVKEGLFSAIQFDIEGRRVLDLFAGSGQLGIEALSRGAISVDFVDSSADCVAVIQKNLISTGLADRARVTKTQYDAFLAAPGEAYGLIFLDPPYASGLLPDAMLRAAARLCSGGLLVCEHPADAILPDPAEPVSLLKRHRYGRTHISIYRKAGDSE